MNTYEWAKFYRELGLAPIPARYGDKRPEINWLPYQHRKPTEGEIKRWFDDGREHNVAIVCGPVSDNLVVLDFDDVSVYERFFDTGKLEADMMVVRTGGGKRHIYIRTQKPVASFRIPQIKLEVRSSGNIVIAPPSLHPCGRRYEFVSREVKGIPVVEDLEQVIWDVAEEKFGIKRLTYELEEPGGFREFSRSARTWRGRHPPCIKKLLEGVQRGFRNEAALRLAGYFLFVRDLEPKEAGERLRAWNRLNLPPLPERELERVLRSAYHRGYIFGCRGLAAFCDRENCAFERAAWRGALRRSRVEELLEELEVVP